jgi:Ca2+-binding EF-hand superfamily protein
MNNPPINLDKLEEVFFLFASSDENGTSLIGINQLKKINDELELGLTENEIDAEFEKFTSPSDEGQEGEITEAMINKQLNYDKFYKLMKTILQKRETYETVYKGLNHLDKSGKGFIDNTYFRYLLMTYANAGDDAWDLYDCEDMIKTLDPDKEGKLNIKELCDVAFQKEKPRAAKPKEPEKGKDGKKPGKKK